MKKPKKIETKATAAAEQPVLYELSEIELADPAKDKHSPLALVVMDDEPAVTGGGGEAATLTTEALAKLEGEGAAEELAAAADLLRSAQAKVVESDPDKAEQLGKIEQLLRSLLVGSETANETEVPAEEQMEEAEASLRRFAAGRVHSKVDMQLIGLIDKTIKAVRKMVKKLKDRQKVEAEEKAAVLGRARAAAKSVAGKELGDLMEAMGNASYVNEDGELSIDDKTKLSEGRSLLWAVSSILYKLQSDEEAVLDPIGTIEKRTALAADLFAGFADEKVKELREKLAAFLAEARAEAEAPAAEEEAPAEEAAARTTAAVKPGRFSERLQWTMRATAARKSRDDDKPDFEICKTPEGVLYVKGVAVLVEEGDRIDERTTATKKAIEQLVKSQRWAGIRIEVEHPSEAEQKELPGGRVMARGGKLTGPLFGRTSKAGKAQCLSAYHISSPEKVVHDFAVARAEKEGSPYQSSYDTMCIGRVEKDADGADHRYIEEFGEGFAMAIVVTGAYSNATWNAREAAALKSANANTQPNKEPNMTKPATDNLAVLDRGVIADKAASAARARMEALRFTERETACAEQWIAATFTDTWADTAEAKDPRKFIVEGLDTLRAKIAEPKEKSAPAIEVGATTHDKASVIVSNFFNPNVMKPGGMIGFREMAGAFINAVGYRPADGQSYRPGVETVYRTLAGAGRVLRVYGEESSFYRSPEDRRFSYIEDPQARMDEAKKWAAANLLGDTFPWEGTAGTRDRAALTSTGLPLMCADALNKMAIEPLKEDVPGPGNPPDSVVVRTTIPVKDFRNIKLIERQAQAMPIAMAEGAIYSDLPDVTERQETFAAQYFGGLVTVTNHAKLADDLGILEKVPDDLLTSAKRNRNRSIWRVLVNNPAMADGALLYSVTHANSNANLYSFEELLNTSELVEGQTAASQGLTDEQEHAALSVTDIVSSLGTKNAILRDTLLDTQPDTAERGANAFVRAFGNVKVWHRSMWDTAGTTNRIVLIGKPFLVMGYLDGISQPLIYVQEDPRVLASNATVYKVVDGHGVGIEHFRTSAAFL